VNLLVRLQSRCHLLIDYDLCSFFGGSLGIFFQELLNSLNSKLCISNGRHNRQKKNTVEELEDMSPTTFIHIMIIIGTYF
jgi:hypothetical protein